MLLSFELVTRNDRRVCIRTFELDDDRLPQSFGSPSLLAGTRAESYYNIRHIFWFVCKTGRWSSWDRRCPSLERLVAARACTWPTLVLLHSIVPRLRRIYLKEFSFVLCILLNLIEQFLFMWCWTYHNIPVVQFEVLQMNRKF